ncbi:hypothetical protein MANES_02G127800v8 [Manihot esculenta]|uniref:Uncharacterized protein n=1 Tax=Manihot esculenta TaxID=3983 RepID=A0ACB7I6P6_MANES|nr:hypothetical protein MANES_02G127800v8 [Manihot esculenta]
MEGLIPYFYKVIVQYNAEGQTKEGSSFGESTSAHYVRLPGDSGRFNPSCTQLFHPEYVPTSSASAAHPTLTSQLLALAGSQSPAHLPVSHRFFSFF